MHGKSMRILSLGASGLLAFCVLCLTLVVLVEGSPGDMDGENAVSAATVQSEPIKLVGQIGGSAQAVAKQGDYVYLGVGPRLVTVDVSNPDEPAVVRQSEPHANLVGELAIGDDLL
jgi:hypothetical protein